MNTMNLQYRCGTTIRRAFSLVELMIVLAILVLLAGLVLPRLLGQQNKADIKATQTQLNSFKQALQNYAIDVRTFPNTEEGLRALVVRPEDEQRARKWDGKYLDEIPVDPWGNEYNYEYPLSQHLVQWAGWRKRHGRRHQELDRGWGGLGWRSTRHGSWQCP